MKLSLINFCIMGSLQGTIIYMSEGVSAESRYTVTYKARFKWLLGTTCSGPKSPLFVECHSGGTLNAITTSHQTITFLPQDDSSAIFGEGSCTTYEECSKVFVTDDPNDDVYGELFFTCSGDYKGQTGATVTYQAGEASSCSSNIWFGTYGYHLIQLGVLCGDDGGSVGDDVEFSFPSQWMECEKGFFEDIDAKYGCVAGESCGGASCAVLEYYADATVVSDPARFAPDCFDVNDLPPGETLTPTQAPSPSQFEKGEYSARYRALWTADTDRGTAFEFHCDVAPPVVLISCLVGASLTLVDTLFPETNCSLVDENTAECRETCPPTECSHYWSKTTRRYSGVTFDCHANDSPPAAEATYLSANYSTAGCWSSASFYEVDHRIQLGTYCGDRFSGDYSYNDLFVECGPDADFFSLSKSTDGFECISWAGPLVGTDFSTPNVTIFTEADKLGGRDDCFTFEAAPTASPSPTMMPTPSPTVSPTPKSNLGDSEGGNISSGKWMESSVATSLLSSLAFMLMLDLRF